MLTVEPSGSTKLATPLLTPILFSAHSRDTGSVAEDDEVENAMSWAGRAARMNAPHGMRPNMRTSPP